MNWTEDFSRDAALLFQCDMTVNEFVKFVDDMGWMAFVDSSQLISVFLGPVLWSLSWLSIVLNILVVFPDLLLTFSSTSIFTSSISLTLVMQALLLLCQWDLLQGKSQRLLASLFFYPCHAIL